MSNKRLVLVVDDSPDDLLRRTRILAEIHTQVEAISRQAYSGSGTNPPTGAGYQNPSVSFSHQTSTFRGFTMPAAGSHLDQSSVQPSKLNRAWAIHYKISPFSDSRTRSTRWMEPD